MNAQKGLDELAEEVARIIDPKGWASVDYFGSMPGGELAPAFRVVEPSLRKADEILKIVTVARLAQESEAPDEGMTSEQARAYSDMEELYEADDEARADV